jgi:hypothetical protein
MIPFFTIRLATGGRDDRERADGVFDFLGIAAVDVSETASVLRGLPDRCLCRLKANPGMRAVTERLGGGSAAAAKRDTSFDGIKFPLSVFQFHRAVHDQGPVSTDFYSYF